MLSKRRRRENQYSVLHLAIVLFLVLVASGIFSVTNAFNPLLALPHRLLSLGAMLRVGWASGVSITMFQTVTDNQTLTPSILGLGALCALLQVILLLVLRAAGLSSLPGLGAFALTPLAMIGMSVALMGTVLGTKRSATTSMLLGIVSEVLLRSGTIPIQWLLDLNDSFTLQDRLLASFSSINPDLLVFSLVLTIAMSILAIRELWAFDVVTLRPDAATAFGVDHRRISRRVMAMVVVLVSVSTALVGPIMFLGLLVAHLAHWAADINRHVIAVHMVALAAMSVPMIGQTVLAQVPDADNALSVIIEFLSGVILIALIISPRGYS